MNLPHFSTNAIFHDPRQFELEMQTLFFDNWTLAGMADQLPGPEKWFVYESWGRSIVIARDRESRLHGFVNSCSHRGTRLCKPDGFGTGRIQCPYHGWVFDCSGKLIGASSRAGFPPFDNKDYGLIPVSVGQVGQFIFTHNSPNPAKSLAETLGATGEMLDGLFPSMTEPLHKEQFSIKSNWKFAVSGAIEDYHLPAVHGQSFNRGRKEAARPVMSPGGHSSFAAPRFNALKRQQLFENDLVFPNTIVIRTGGFVHVTTCTPLSPELTIHTSRLYDTATRFKSLRARFFRRIGIKGVEKGYREDKEAVEAAHMGTSIAPNQQRGPTHFEEVRVDHFLNEVKARVHLAANSLLNAG